MFLSRSFFSHFCQIYSPMKTSQIADSLKLTAQLQELHGVNPFKVKAVANAAYRLDKTDINLEGKSLEELSTIEGIGKSIAAKIYELQTTGKLNELEEVLALTPDRKSVV